MVGILGVAAITDYCCIMLLNVKDALIARERQSQTTSDDLKESTALTVDGNKYAPMLPKTVSSSSSSSSSSSQFASKRQSVMDGDSLETSLLKERVSVVESLPLTDAMSDENMLSMHFSTYQDVIFRLWGWGGKILVLTFLFLTQFGFCVGYFVFLIQTTLTMIHPSLYLSSLTPPWIIRWVLPFVIGCVFMLLLIPTVLLKRVKLMSPISALANTFIVIGLLLFSAYNMSVLGERAVEAEQTGNLHNFFENTSLVNIWTFPLFFGIMTSSFEGIGLVIPISHSMHQYSSRYRVLLHVVIAILLGILVFFGAGSYIAFQEDTQQVITANLPTSLPGGYLTLVIKICLLMGILATYPLQMFPVAEIMDNLLVVPLKKLILQRNHSEHVEANDTVELPVEEMGAERAETAANVDTETSKSFYQTIRSDLLAYVDPIPNAIRIVLVFITMFLAVLIPFFGYISALIGSFGSSMLAYILPASLHLHMNIIKYREMREGEREKEKDKDYVPLQSQSAARAWLIVNCLKDVGVIIFGFTVMIVGTIVAIYSIIDALFPTETNEVIH